MQMKVIEHFTSLCLLLFTLQAEVSWSPYVLGTNKSPLHKTIWFFDLLPSRNLDGDKLANLLYVTDSFFFLFSKTFVTFPGSEN